MECGARVMRKSTTPAGGTSKPCLHIPNTRHNGGGWCNSSKGSILFGTILRGCYNPTDDDPKWKPKGGAVLPVHPYDTSPRAPERTLNLTKQAIRV